MTRWACRADALYIRAAFPVVVQALEILSQDGDVKVRGYLCSDEKFDFIITLCAAEHVLFNKVASSIMLQGNNVDLIEAAQEARVVINIIKAERGNPVFGRNCMCRGNKLQLSFTLAMHSKINCKATTQGECPKHKPRVLLAKSCVPPSY